MRRPYAPPDSLPSPPWSGRPTADVRTDQASLLSKCALEASVRLSRNELGHTPLVIPGYVRPSANMRRILRLLKLAFLASQISRQTSAHKGNDRGVRISAVTHPGRGRRASRGTRELCDPTTSRPLPNAGTATDAGCVRSTGTAG